MFKLRPAALAVIFIVTVVVLVPTGISLPRFLAEGQQPATAPLPGRSDLPPGPMQETARNACTVCHDAGIIVQQRLNKDAWGREVDKMVRWGTVLDPKDRDPLVAYFAANFPPEKRTDPPSRVAPGK